MKKSDNDSDIKRIATYFKRREEVSALYLFGSLAKSRGTKESDIDIAILVNEKQLKRRNFERLKNEYYLASPTFTLRLVDIIILNTASPYLKHRVLKTGRILFDKNRKLRVNFTAKAIIEYLDFRPIEDIFNKAVANRFRRAAVG
ncbi:MAG: nucleotidyltransferase domain-containing protein [Nitrospirae bacterium]|nr:nucleotidyltransferase domain-containing protein [Nitrospirota bacterium]